MVAKSAKPRVKRNESKTAAEFKAFHQYAKGSPQKARLVMDQIRGLPISDALDLLQYSNRRAAFQIRKVLSSAVANANHALEEDLIRDAQGIVIQPQPDVDIEDLYVHEAQANDGPRQKRWRPRARGAAFPYRKYTCHLTIRLRPLSGAGKK